VNLAADAVNKPKQSTRIVQVSRSKCVRLCQKCIDRRVNENLSSLGCSCRELRACGILIAVEVDVATCITVASQYWIAACFANQHNMIQGSDI
jgi:hypothetical protein